MRLPTVAIVGRPNVGKSSVLNRLVGQRISIVDPTPGVTRDRISVPCPIGEGYVELVDTGGIGIVDHDDLTDHVEDQIAYGLAEANLLIFLVDAREGVTPLDRHVAERLRRLAVPVILVANKIDEFDMTAETAEFNSLGFGEPIAVSAHHGLGMDRLTEQIARVLGELPESPPEAALMKLAIVGKRNAGKSTFINTLAGEKRVIVSETPGTTRDSVDVTVEIDSRKFMLIDTAGVRKRRRIVQNDIEFYSYHRALRSIRRADVVALMIDASVPVSKVDKDLSRDIVDEFKPVLLVVNKWDLARNKAAGEDYADYFAKVLPELSYAPICLTSATTGVNVHQTIRLAEQLYDQSRIRVTTAKLNTVVAEITAKRGPSHKSGTRPPKILYVSQITTCPPTIVCFVNDVRSFDRGYQRFLVNQLRLHLPYAEVPIRVLFRSRRDRDGVRAVELPRRARLSDTPPRDEDAEPTIPSESESERAPAPARAKPSKAPRAPRKPAPTGKAKPGGSAGKGKPPTAGKAKPGGFAGKVKPASSTRKGKPSTAGGAKPKGRRGSPKPGKPSGPRKPGGPKRGGAKGGKGPGPRSPRKGR